MKKKILQRSLALGALMAFAITGSALAADKEITGNNITNTDIDGTLYTTQDSHVNGNVSIKAKNIGSKDRPCSIDRMAGTIKLLENGYIHTSQLKVRNGGTITADNLYLYNSGILEFEQTGNQETVSNISNILGNGKITIRATKTLVSNTINIDGDILVYGNLKVASNVATKTQLVGYEGADIDINGELQSPKLVANAGSNMDVGSLSGLNGGLLEEVRNDGSLTVKETMDTKVLRQKNANAILKIQNLHVDTEIENQGHIIADQVNAGKVGNSGTGNIEITGDSYFGATTNNGNIKSAGKVTINGYSNLAANENAVFETQDLLLNAGGEIGTGGRLIVNDKFVVNAPRDSNPNKGNLYVYTSNIELNDVVVNNGHQIQFRDGASNVNLNTVTLNDGSIQAYNKNTLTINELNSVKGKIQAWGQKKDELTTINIVKLNIDDGNEFRANNYSGADSILNISEMNLGNGAEFYNVDRINYDGNTEPDKGIAFKPMRVDTVNSNGGVIINNGEMTIATASGSSLTIQHDTLDDKVSICRNEIEKLSVVSSSDNVGENIQTSMQAIADTVAIADGNKVKTVYAKAGDVYGDIMGITDNKGILTVADEYVNQFNQGISEMASIALMTWRQENNDMNKRLGELRDSAGEHGVWVRMTRGESKYGVQNIKNQYNSYQLGYDEKLSKDKHWTVGAALTYTDAESSFSTGKGENKHKGLAIYGSRLNDDGSFIDLIAKYARLEHEFDVNGGSGKGDFDTNGYSLSAEYGKRFTKDNGLWIEPQVELTYGRVSGAKYITNNGVRVCQEGMDSLVGRLGFALGQNLAKDKGNVYLRASYLYDFDGETNAAFAKNGIQRNFEQDLGGGWWEVGIGANINLSNASHLYFDVEKTYGGNVATPWQWNAGVRWSF